MDTIICTAFFIGYQDYKDTEKNTSIFMVNLYFYLYL